MKIYVIRNKEKNTLFTSSEKQCFHLMNNASIFKVVT